MPGLQRLLLHEPSASDSASGRSQPIHVVPDPAEPPLRPATESHSAPGFEYAPNETINQVGGWLKWEPETLRAFREQAKQLIEQMPQEVAKQLARTAVGFVPVVRVVVAAYETAEQVAGVAGRAFEGKTTKEDKVTITVWAFTILAAVTGGRGPRPQGGGAPRALKGSVADRVAASVATISDDALVNFGSVARGAVDPSTGPRSYWFRYGDIKHLNPKELQAVIGDIASAGQPGGATVMRVSDATVSAFTKKPPTTKFFDIPEFTVDSPVRVSCNVPIGE